MVKLSSLCRLILAAGIFGVLSGCADKFGSNEIRSLDQFCSDEEVDASRTCIAPMGAMLMWPDFFYGRRVVTSGVLSNRDGYWAVFSDMTQVEVGFIAASIPISDLRCEGSLGSLSLDRHDSVPVEIIGEPRQAGGSGKYRLAGMPKITFEKVEKITTYINGRVSRTFSCE